ncbi:acyltransferase [Candidatus Woesearchaeota archaeon]|nr:acyltransferase [Candidatus Woesearchaeota archaeon]
MINTIDAIKKKFLEVQEKLTEVMQEKYDRILPITELLSDRWKRAKLAGLGKGCSLYESVYIYGKPKVGEETKINPFVILDASGGELIIGDGCSIASQVMIFTHSTHMKCVSENKCPIIKKPVSIGSYVFIGSGAVILPGSRIGSHCIIGANAVVSKDIPNNSIVAGNPARVIGEVRLAGGKTELVYFNRK